MKSFNVFYVALTIVLIMPFTSFAPVVSVQSSTSDEWPMFYHDTCHTGYSSSEAPDYAYVLWTYQTGSPISSSPSVANGKVFIVPWNGYLHALDALTGDLKWIYSLGVDYYDCPTVSDGRVFLGYHKSPVLRVLNEATGVLLWSYNTPSLGIYSPPIVSGGRVYFVTGIPSIVYALSEADGSLIWSSVPFLYPPFEDVYGSPAVCEGKIYLGAESGIVYALNENDGSRIWSYNTYDIISASSPVIADGRVFIGTGSVTGFLYALDALTGGFLWCYPLHGGGAYSTPAVASGRVYMTSSDGSVYAIDATDGTLIWESKPGGTIIGGMAVADGKIFIGSHDYNVYALSESDGSIIWKYMTGEAISWSSPAVAYGNLYIGSQDGKVYAFPSIVDTTPPTTSVTLDGIPIQEGWFRSDVAVTLTASDDLSGVSQTLYSINYGDWQEYIGAFTLSDEGPYTIQYYSTDKAGNIEEIKSVSFTIDKPWTSVTIYIRPDGSVYPEDAPISRDEDVYTFTDNIAVDDSIMIERDNIVVDGNGYTLWGTELNGGDYLRHGFHMSGRSSVTIKNTNIEAFVYGIWVDSSSNIAITQNNITDNHIGISLRWSSNIVVTSNNVANNVEHGIYGEGWSNSVIYHNNFVSNTRHVYLWLKSYGNIWDEGYPSGGNYWDDYDGVDNFNGPNQDQPGSDGIGDTPYIVYESNKDNYPLMNPWTPMETSISVMGEDYPVIITSNTTIDQIVTTGNTLNFTSSGPDGAIGYMRVIFPKINTTEIKVFIDDVELTPPPFPVFSQNETHYFIYFEYTLSIHNIAIQFAGSLPATVDITPHYLSLRSKGERITAYIELPEGYNVADINVSSITLNDTILAEAGPISIGDYDYDTISDLMVKFNRASVIQYIINVIAAPENFGTVTLTVKGKLIDNTPFEGSYTIKIVA